MIQAPKKRGRKPQDLKQFPILLRPDQIETMHAAANERGKKQGNALMRDVVDFWSAHQTLFFAWLASRSNERL